MGGFILEDSGYDEIRGMRKLERIPHMDAIAAIPDEVSMQGRRVLQRFILEDESPELPEEPPSQA